MNYTLPKKGRREILNAMSIGEIGTEMENDMNENDTYVDSFFSICKASLTEKLLFLAIIMIFGHKIIVKCL